MGATGGAAPRDLAGALLAVGAPPRMVERIATGPAAHAAVDHEVALRLLDAGCVEMRLSVRGPGRAGAALLDLRLLGDGLLLHTMRGGHFEATFPPRAYAPSVAQLNPGAPMPLPERLLHVRFGSQRGRSSDAEMPFLLLSDARGEDGLWVALGWSGFWEGDFSRDPAGREHRLRLAGPGRELELGAGEELELPRVLVGGFRGDGWAAVRHALRAMTPRPSPPWSVYNSFFNESLQVDEPRLLRHLDVAAEIGIEVFTVDAGWYPCPRTDDMLQFSTAGIGTWEVDRDRFPRGLEATAGAVHDAGLLFGLWFEPERAHPESRVWREHPQWILRHPEDRLGLVDFGIAEARNWAVETLSGAVSRWGLDWIKWDFNADAPLGYWSGDERRELGHVNGVYAVLDELRRRHPDLRLEMCAGGGNRVDVEMLSRADSQWISDQTFSPGIVRHTLAGAAAILPAQFRYLSLSPQRGGDGDDYPDEWFAGMLSGVFGIMDRISEWSPATRRRAAHFLAEHRSLRHLLDGEVRRLRGDGATPLGAWDCLEFSEPGGEAVLLAFRQESQHEQVRLRGARDWSPRLPPRGAAVLRTGG